MRKEIIISALIVLLSVLEITIEASVQSEWLSVVEDLDPETLITVLGQQDAMVTIVELEVETGNIRDVHYFTGDWV